MNVVADICQGAHKVLDLHARVVELALQLPQVAACPRVDKRRKIGVFGLVDKVVALKLQLWVRQNGACTLRRVLHRNPFFAGPAQGKLRLVDRDIQ